MRDLALTGVFFWFLAQILKKPHVGILLMAWLGYMNPHRLTWGFAYHMPFAMMATAVTLLAAMMYLFSAKKKLSYGKTLFPWNASTIILIVFIMWVGITTIFAEHQSYAYASLVKFFKVQVGIFLTLLLINTKERILLLVAVFSFSIAFYGIKGGVFAIATGGSYLIWGPEGSFIEGNNEIALALILVLPFVYFFFTYLNNKWIKRFLLVCCLLMLASIISSYSRGALLALCGAGFFLWWHSKNKVGIGIGIILLTLMALPLMPDAWFDRMDTIQSYEEDASAMGRINAWHMAFNMATDRITGGGFDGWSYYLFTLYAPNPADHHDAHSIYFEVLGEHGFIGLALFLLFYSTIWFSANRAIKKARMKEDAEWAVTLLKMCKVSLVGYASGGAFLGLAFFDLPYHVATVILLVAKLLNDFSDKTPNKSNSNMFSPTFKQI